MDNAGASGDSLTIPLGGAIRRVEDESSPRGRDARRSFLFLALLVFLIFSNGLVRGRLPHISVLLLIIMVFVAYNAWRKIWYARKLLKFYGGVGAPELVLDAQGITCPIILMDYISNAAGHVMRSGQSVLRIKWGDIGRWSVTLRSQRTLAGLYLLDLKGAVPELATIAIKRDFTPEEEQKIVHFAQSFLSIPVGPLPPPIEDGEPGSINGKVIYLGVVLAVVIVLMNLTHGSRMPPPAEETPAAHPAQGSR